jgi:uncharacterized RDD family membrane protein YckC
MFNHEEHPNHADHKEITIETLSTPPPKILPAPLLRRFGACVVDSAIIGTAFIALIVVSRASSMLWKISVSLPEAAYLISLTFLYYFVQEALFAATIGKSILRLRVLGKDGDPCSTGASFKRNSLRFLDWLPFLYVIAGIAVLMSRNRQRIGDRIAATVVANTPKKDINPPPAPFLFH